MFRRDGEVFFLGTAMAKPCSTKSAARGGRRGARRLAEGVSEIKSDPPYFECNASALNVLGVAERGVSGHQTAIHCTRVSARDGIR